MSVSTTTFECQQCGASKTIEHSITTSASSTEQYAFLPRFEVHKFDGTKRHVSGLHLLHFCCQACQDRFEQEVFINRPFKKK